MIRLLAAITMIASLAPHAGAAEGYVWAGGDLHRGQLSLDGDQVRIGDQKWAFDQVAMIVPTHRTTRPMRTAAVRLRDGQRWPAQVEHLDRKTLSVEGPLIGRRRIALSDVAGFDLGGRGPMIQAPPPVVIQKEGEAIPGRLMWMDEMEIGIESPLGVLKLPRSRASRVELAGVDRPESVDIVRLFDGTVLQGDVTLERGRVVIEHNTLGQLDFALDAIASVTRQSSGRRWLTRTDAWRVEARDVFGQPRPAPDAIQADGMVRVEAPATVQIDLQGNGQPKRFLAMVEPLERAAGDVTLSFVAGEKTLATRTLGPGDGPKVVNIELPRGAKALAVEVSPGKRLTFPAGAVIRDAQLIGGGE